LYGSQFLPGLCGSVGAVIHPAILKDHEWGFAGATCFFAAQFDTEMAEIAVIDYGAGNVRSVCFALERLGVQPVVTADSHVIATADRVIFPGVGHARAAMDELARLGLDRLIPTLTQPVLGICLGMQLMCAHTEEGDVRGLGIFPEKVTLFRDVPKVPHMGWNSISALRGPLMAGIGEGEHVYFVHSYHVPVSAHASAVCDYGAPFAAAMGRDNFHACQFHPEKSAEAGARILANFLQL
jgi:glutamine amidotransferase